MEFKSTLEREDKRLEEGYAKAKAAGKFKDTQLKEVLNLVINSRGGKFVQSKSIEIAKTIQPSISGNDLQIACTMQCAMSTQLVYSLLKEGLISINK